jgi:hypothetical protein
MEQAAACVQALQLFMMVDGHAAQGVAGMISRVM